MKSIKITSKNLVIFALNYIFFVSLFTQTGYGSDLVNVFRFVAPGFAILIVAGMRARKYQLIGNRYRMWFNVLIYIFVPIACLRAFCAGEEMERIITGVIPYFMFSLIFVGADDSIWKQLNKVFLIQTGMAILLLLLNLPAFNIVNRYLFTSKQTDMFLYSRLLYGFPFLLFTFRFQNIAGKAIAIVGALAYGMSGVLGQYRGMFYIRFLFCVALAIFIFCMHKKKHVFINVVKVCSLIIVSVMVIGAVFLSFFPEGTKTVLSKSFNTLVHRSDKTILADKRSWRDEPRWKETVEEVLPQITMSEWIIGRGVAFHYYYISTGSRRSMVHITPVQLIMQGGVLLLLLIIIGPAYMGFKMFRMERDIITVAAAGILVVFVVMFIAKANPVNTLWFALVCLSTGRCFSRANKGMSSGIGKERDCVDMVHRDIER